jgi:hypothetical protein
MALRSPQLTMIVSREDVGSRSNSNDLELQKQILHGGPCGLTGAAHAWNCRSTANERSRIMLFLKKIGSRLA